MPSVASTPSTSVSLIERVRVLDPEAWHTLSRLYGPLVYQWARRSGLQSQDAADVLQNVLMSVMRGIATFSLDRPGSSFRGWLRTITRNAVRELMRRQRSVPVAAGGTATFIAMEAEASDAESDTDAADPEAFTALTHRAVQLVRERVDPATWDAFWRTTVAEESVADVATSLQMTATAVRQAKYRVLCHLRDLLADR